MLKNTLSTLITAALLIQSGAVAYGADTASDLANTHTWRALLHYEQGLSNIKDSAFFMADNGASNPEAELLATVEAFKTQPQTQCKFAARYKWIKQKGALKNVSKADCPDVAEYTKKVAAKRLSLVFASEKMPSPTSMMGHLFIKVEGQAENYNPEHSLSFFATLHGGMNALLFVPKALVAGTEGRFILEPYKKTKARYENDGRQLKEFPLELTQEQVDLVVLHAWELKETELQYSLAYDNCATTVMPLLAVAGAEYNGLAYKPFMTPYDLLDEMSGRRLVDPVLKRKSLTKVSRSSNIAIAYAHTDGDSFAQIKIQPAYKNLMEFVASPLEAEVELFNLTLNVDDNSGIDLQNFTLFKTKTYVPTHILAPVLSKYFEASVLNTRLASDSKLAVNISGGVGLAPHLKTQYFKPFVYLNSEYRIREGEHAFNVVPESGAILYITSRDKLFTSAKRRFSTNNFDYKYEFQTMYAHHLMKNLDLNLVYDWAKTYDNQSDQRWIVSARLHF